MLNNKITKPLQLITHQTIFRYEWKSIEKLLNETKD